MWHEKRWAIAQDYEKRHWEEAGRKISAGRSDLKWYQWRAGRTVDRLAQCGLSLSPQATLVEIGSGPVGQVGFLPGLNRHAFDPLMSFYDRDPALTAERPKGVRYVEARGESVPLDDGAADLVIVENCIDHCADPALVLAECFRILRADGLFYLTVNVRSAAGRGVRTFIDRLMPVDQGHPYSYTGKGIREAVREAGFSEIRIWREGFGQALRSNGRESWPRTSIKVATLTLERLFEGLWRKPGG